MKNLHTLGNVALLHCQYSRPLVRVIIINNTDTGNNNTTIFASVPKIAIKKKFNNRYKNNCSRLLLIQGPPVQISKKF